VLGPWTNGRVTNIFTGAVVAVLVMLSVILTAAVLFPNIGTVEIVAVLVGGSLIAAVMSLVLWRIERRANHGVVHQKVSLLDRSKWTMPPLEQLTAARWTPLKRTWMFVLRGYLVIAHCRAGHGLRPHAVMKRQAGRACVAGYFFSPPAEAAAP
jgi:hypothetical protein